MFTWGGEVIRFRRDAEEYTHFSELLARRTLAYIDKNAHVLDAGCGLGYMALELANTARQVTAVDLSAEAISFLNNRAAGLRVANVDAVCADVFGYECARRFDAAVFCMFATVIEALSVARRLCKPEASVVIIKMNREYHRFGAGKTPRNAHMGVGAKETLSRHGIPFSHEEFTLESGQPFRSIDDAVRFFELYGGDAPSRDALTRELEAARGEFEFFLKRPANMSLFALKAGDIPKIISMEDK